MALRRRAPTTTVLAMGRSRRRQRLAAASNPSSPARAAKAPAATVPPPAELRRVLGAYLVGAIVLAVLVLLGTLTLAGTLAPWLVLVVDAAGAYGLHRWASGRLAGLEMTDEDRVLQTLAGGLLVVVLAFAAIAAAILTVV
jgi:hypothetical protein